jgi:hypothetical protein
VRERHRDADGRADVEAYQGAAAERLAKLAILDIELDAE